MQKKRLFSRILGLLLSSWVVMGVGLERIGEAATYYVSTSGSDANPGTAALTFRTVNKGVSVLSPGDTLYIRAGTYPEALTASIPAGTSWSSAVTLKAYPGETPILKPSAGANFVLLFDNAQRYIEVDGLVLDGASVGFDVVKIYVDHIRIRNCELKNAPGNGILSTHVGADDGYHEFINNTIHHGGTSNFTNAIYLETGNNLVQGNHIYNWTGSGIQIFNQKGRTTHNTIVRNNKVHDVGTNLPGYRGQGIILSMGDNLVAYNNIVYNLIGTQSGGSMGISAWNGNGIQIYNNTVYVNNPLIPGIVVEDSDTSNAIIKNNIIYGTMSSAIENRGVGTILSNNVTTNPLFVNAGIDFRLSSGSPAIDAGLALSSVVDDFSGQPRPQGSAYDIGAYEFGASSTTTTPPSNLRIAGSN